MGEDSVLAKLGMLVVLIVLMLVMVGSCSGLGFVGGTRTCEGCGMSCEANDPGDDYSSIGKTGMCCDCYAAYQWVRSGD